MKFHPRIFILLGMILPSSQAMADPQETLTHALTTAYQNNPSLESERAKLRATDEDVAQALSHWRPSVEADANVGKTYQYVPEFKPLGSANYSGTSHSYGVQLTQPLFRGFKTLSETEAAEKEVAAGRAKLNLAEQKLFMDTATAFLDTVRDREIVEADRNNEAVLKEKLTETEARAKEGELTQTDIRQAESRLARAEVSRLQTENTLSDDIETYTRLVGYPPGPLEKPNLVLFEPRSLHEAQDIAVTRNPEVVAAQYTFESAKAQTQDNEGSLLPEIDLVGSSNSAYGQDVTLPGRSDTNQVLVQLKFPLYDGGSSYSKIRAARETATQHRMELEEARHHAHELIGRAWKTLSTAEEAIRADLTEIEAAGKALEGVKVESKAGTRTTLDVLNAEQELLDAKVEMAKSEHDRNLAVMTINDALGRLTVEDLNLPIAGYNPVDHYNKESGALIGIGTDEDTYISTSNIKDAETQ